MSDKAVIYARYSSHNQTEQSIEGQLAAAHKYAAEKGYFVVGEYCDRAKTGTNDNREAFQQMLRDCTKGQFKVIITWKIDRIGRNRNELAVNKHHIKKNGVRIEYVTEQIPDSAEGILVEALLEGLAEYYSASLSENIRRGKLESAKKFQVIGGSCPIGYRVGEDKRYEIVPEDAEIVKTIFDMYSEGFSMAEVARYLNSRNYRPNGKPFTRNSIPRILKNERYTGVYIYKNIIREEGAIPPIITKEQFEKVQTMMKYNSRKPNSGWNYSDYLLTNRIYCGHCGATIVGISGTSKSGRKYSYYACSDSRGASKTCDLPKFSKEKLEDLVVDYVNCWVLDPPFLQELTDAVWKYHQELEFDTEEARLQKGIDNNRAALDNLTRAVEQGMPYEAVKTRLETLEEERDQLELKLARIRLEGKLRLTREHIEFFLFQFLKKDYTDRKCQRQLIKAFVNRIDVYDDKITIALNYSGKDNLIPITDIKEALADDRCSSMSAPLETRKQFKNTIYSCIIPDLRIIYVELPLRKK